MSSGIHKSRLSRALVVAQVSLSLLLLICAGLFTRSLWNAQRSDLGFDPDHVLVASYDLGSLGFSDAQGIAFHRQLIAKLSTLPGVESVTMADFSPLSFTIHSDYIQPEGYVSRAGESMEVSRAIVGPNYFRTMRTPTIAGRDFTEQDTEKSQLVAIVNEAFANRYWPGQEAIGKRFNEDGRWFNVVGVARNGKYRRLVYAPEPVFFQPLYQRYRGLVMIHARVNGDPRSYAAAAEVLRLVLGQGLLLTLSGLAAGIAMSLALTRYLKSALFGVATSDLWTYAAVTILLCLVSLVACYIPARRAMKVDPMLALRYEQ